VDFELTETQEAIAELAGRLVADTVTEERQREVEEDGHFDRLLWERLSSSGLLGIGVAEELGGMGGGMLDIAVLLEALGGAVAYTPVFPSLVPATLGLARFGGDGARALVSAFVVGDALPTFAPGTMTERIQPIVATGGGDGWVLDGLAPQVPYWHESSGVVLAAKGNDGTALLFVRRELAGIDAQGQETTTGEIEFDLHLRDVHVPSEDLLVTGAEADEALRWMHQRGVVALCALQLGAVDRLLRMTAEYTSTRHQFGRAIGSFQAVQQRLADAYIDVEAIRWTMWQAAWALDNDLNEDGDVDVAKFWASEGGQRIVSACLHLHGGMGVDVTYPLHRYYLRAKKWELTLGSATEHLVALGRQIATALPRQYAQEA
jgi:3-oxocholest-4-en-26-oyl-CoA dehydrogenase beta subunit